MGGVTKNIDDPGEAVVLTLERTQVSACSHGSLVSKGKFTGKLDCFTAEINHSGGRLAGKFEDILYFSPEWLREIFKTFFLARWPIEIFYLFFFVSQGGLLKFIYRILVQLFKWNLSNA